MLRCFPALTASASVGTSSRIVVPLPTYAPLPIVTGAISCDIAADERAVADHRLVLPRAVVVAVIVPAPMLTLRADRGVSQIGEMPRLWTRHEHGFLHLDEVADACAFANVTYVRCAGEQTVRPDASDSTRDPRSRE